MAEGYELAFTIGGLFLSLCAFSLIFGDNYLFRLAASILIGAASADDAKRIAVICDTVGTNLFLTQVVDMVQEKAAELGGFSYSCQ